MDSLGQFLSAEWRSLLFANYAVPPDLLQPFVPAGTSLDAHEGVTYVSLVAFLFDKTRILGLPIPGHICFEEVNLRFYVKPDYDPTIRAVTFIKEIVPLASIPLVANTFFGENYEDWPMDHTIQPPHYRYGWGPEREWSFDAKVTAPLSIPGPKSLAEFITEHYWGYSSSPKGTVEYQVQHPQWPCVKTEQFEINLDFAACYGSEFALLQHQQPSSVLFAEGSAVSVSLPRLLKV